MAKIDPFEFVESINVSKKDLMKEAADQSYAEKCYNPWLTNQALSYHPDTIYYANVMNGNYHLDNRLQYSYLINTVRPKKRYSKWVKKREDGVVDAVASLYNYNRIKAKAALQILSPEQINRIRTLKGEMT